MTKIVCPLCKSGFEAQLSPGKTAVNCPSCHVAFDAASQLLKSRQRQVSPSGGTSPGKSPSEDPREGASACATASAPAKPADASVRPVESPATTAPASAVTSVAVAKETHPATTSAVPGGGGPAGSHQPSEQVRLPACSTGGGPKRGIAELLRPTAAVSSADVTPAAATQPADAGNNAAGAKPSVPVDGRIARLPVKIGCKYKPPTEDPKGADGESPQTCTAGARGADGGDRRAASGRTVSPVPRAESAVSADSGPKAESASAGSKDGSAPARQTSEAGAGNRSAGSGERKVERKESGDRLAAGVRAAEDTGAVSSARASGEGGGAGAPGMADAAVRAGTVAAGGSAGAGMAAASGGKGAAGIPGDAGKRPEDSGQLKGSDEDRVLESHPRSPDGKRTSGAPGTRGPVSGDAFGHYKIEGEISRGGMGAVFRARDTRDGRRLALKVISAGGAAGEEEKKRFAREARTAEGLKHPGIVQIYEVGEVAGQPFIAMELVDGSSLDRIIRSHDKGMPVTEAIHIMVAIADTVSYLHQNGLVHRDLKPANILLDPLGVPKVADFGLVRDVEELTRLTQSGSVVGTPAYMAPEQARGEESVDARCDVWALGAMLYEMLTGRPPFRADNALRLMLKITRDDPTLPRLANPAIPKDVQTIIMKCLEKDPARRYRDAGELSADLTAFLEGKPIAAQPPSPLRKAIKAVDAKRSSILTGVAAVAVIAAILWGLSWVLREPGADRLLEEGYAELKAGNAKSAEEKFRRAVVASPEEGRCYLALGMSLGTQAVDRKAGVVADKTKFQEACVALKKARDVNPALTGESRAFMAKMLSWVGAYELAVKELEAAVQSEPRNPERHAALGMACWHAGSRTGRREYLERAYRAFQSVVALQPGHPRASQYMRELKENWLTARQASAR
ncbi:MAG: protein kinase [Planctomycetota bacterium]|nr:protein kinase [Planctomycetota bacterium]